MIIKVNTAVPYSVVIESGAIDKIGAVVATMYKAGTKVMIISETNVFPLYGSRVVKSLEKIGFTVSRFIFGAGEGQKHIGTVSEMYRALAENNFTRADLIITLGGGVTGDMGGFAAATYLRGIDFDDGNFAFGFSRKSRSLLYRVCNW